MLCTLDMAAEIRIPEGAAAEVACWLATPTLKVTPRGPMGAAEGLLRHQELEEGKKCIW